MGVQGIADYRVNLSVNPILHRARVEQKCPARDTIAQASLLPRCGNPLIGAKPMRAVTFCAIRMAGSFWVPGINKDSLNFCRTHLCRSSRQPGKKTAIYSLNIYDFAARSFTFSPRKTATLSQRQEG